MFLTWAIILEPDTNVSEGVMNQMSYHLKHIYVEWRYLEILVHQKF